MASAPAVIPVGRLATSAGSSSGGPLKAKHTLPITFQKSPPETQAGDGADVSYEDPAVHVASSVYDAVGMFGLTCSPVASCAQGLHDCCVCVGTRAPDVGRRGTQPGLLPWRQTTDAATEKHTLPGAPLSPAWAWHTAGA